VSELLTGRAQDLRARLEPLSDFKLLTACSELDTSGDLADPAVAMRHTLVSLAQRWFDLHAEIKIHSAHLKALTRTAAPDLVDAFGVGLDIAAQVLITAGDNNDRVRNEAAVAKMCGVAPIPTGSGKTGGRHRLNRGGEPPSQRRALPGGHRPHALARTNDRLRRATHRRRSLEEGHHQMSHWVSIQVRALVACSSGTARDGLDVLPLDGLFELVALVVAGTRDRHKRPAPPRAEQ
jgi:transposase